MEARKREAIRIDTYAFSVIVRLIAILIFAGTIYIAYQADRLGWTLGVTAQNNPFPWIVLAIGIVASLLTFSMGIGLSMLCAIYDQEKAESDQPIGKLKPDSFYAKDPPFPSRRPWLEQAGDADSLSRSNPPTPARAPHLEATVAQNMSDERDGRHEKSGIWEKLTRERHVFSKRNDQKQ